MVVAVVTGQPRRYLVEARLRQNGDSVESLLAVNRKVITQALKLCARKGFIDAFGFLQTDDVGLPLGQPRSEIINPLLERIDVPGRDAHGREGSAAEPTCRTFLHPGRRKKPPAGGHLRDSRCLTGWRRFN